MKRDIFKEEGHSLDYETMKENEQKKIQNAKIFRKHFDNLVKEDKINPIKIDYSFTKKPGGGLMTLCSNEDCYECNLYKDVYISGMAYGMAKQERADSKGDKNE